MTVLYSNNAASTLASGITNTATSMTVEAGTGGVFPNPGAGEYFYVTLANDDETTLEIVKVTARTNDVLTIERGFDGTTSSSFSTAAKVELRITKIVLDSKEPADATILKDADIGSSVLAFDTNLQAFVTAFTIPTTDGTSGQALITNGSGSIAFGDVDALPSQTGNNSKYLTTNGTASSWSDVVVADISDLTATATELNYTDGVTSNIQTQLNSKLPSSSYTASDVLTKIKTVDGSGSGLDSDLLDGQQGSYYTSYTDTAIANLVDSAPATLDTLNELAAALGDDPNFATTVTNSIATKAPIASPTFTGTVTIPTANVTGNITVSGTVDGRDVAADGTKLDGIESGATADQTAAEILTAVKTVDGTGSGLDADLLDGQQGSYYYPASNPNGYTTNVGDITGVTAGIGLSGGGTSGTVTLTVDLSELTDMTAAMVGTDEFIVLDASSDRRKSANEIGLSIFNNDAGFTTNVGDITGVTAGSYLTGGGTSGTVTVNVDATTTATASKIVARDGNGYVFATYYNSAGTFSTTGATSGMGRFTGTNGTDTYGRSYSAQAAATLLSGSTMNIAGNATTATTATNQSGGTVSATTGTFSTSVNIDGHVLQDSADRSGLLGISTALGTWKGIQIISTGTAYWSIMGDQDDFGIYDDINNEWILQYNENSSLQLNHNGITKLTTSTNGVIVSGTATATTFSGALSGNATTATTLQTARTINGVSFNGSANITVADATKLPLTGGVINGHLDINGNLNAAYSVYVADHIYHEGDTDTRISFGTNTITLQTGGSSEITVNTTGVRLGDSGNGYFQPVTGNYGSVQIDGGAHSAWEGYSIGGRAVFMHDNSNSMGLFNDVNNEWCLLCSFNGATQVYYNGSSKIQTTNTGANVSGTMNATAFTGDGSGLTGIASGVYASKTISSNTTLESNTEYFSGSNTTINNGVSLIVPVSSLLEIKLYSTGKSI